MHLWLILKVKAVHLSFRLSFVLPHWTEFSSALLYRQGIDTVKIWWLSGQTHRARVGYCPKGPHCNGGGGRQLTWEWLCTSDGATYQEWYRKVYIPGHKRKRNKTVMPHWIQECLPHSGVFQDWLLFLQRTSSARQWRKRERELTTKRFCFTTLWCRE